MDITANSKSKKKIEKKLQKIFDSMACENPKTAIHGTALAAAGVVALLPIGVDAWALRLCEIFMLISIYSHFGIQISKSVGESLLSAAFMQTVGETAAFAALEAADAATVATGGLGAPAAFGIKFGIAASLIEAVGWATVKYLEGNKYAEKAVHMAGAIGAAADLGRVGDALGNAGRGVFSADPPAGQGGPEQIAFCGDVQKERHELDLKIKSMEGYRADKAKLLKKDIDNGWVEAAARHRNDIKYATEDLEKMYRKMANL